MQKVCLKPYSICKTNIYKRILRLCLKLDFFRLPRLQWCLPGISKGGFGSGAAFAAAAILATIIEPGAGDWNYASTLDADGCDVAKTLLEKMAEP
jgi:hypothetical protein